MELAVAVGADNRALLNFGEKVGKAWDHGLGGDSEFLRGGVIVVKIKTDWFEFTAKDTSGLFGVQDHFGVGTKLLRSIAGLLRSASSDKLRVGSSFGPSLASPSKPRFVMVFLPLFSSFHVKLLKLRVVFVSFVPSRGSLPGPLFESGVILLFLIVGTRFLSFFFCVLCVVLSVIFRIIWHKHTYTASRLWCAREGW